MSDKLDEIIEDKHNPERMFPILNKYDRAWSAKGELTFCQVFKLITDNKDLSDLEFTKALDKYLEDNGIK